MVTAMRIQEGLEIKEDIVPGKMLGYLLQINVWNRRDVCSITKEKEDGEDTTH
jgi:hypothetical protein